MLKNALLGRPFYTKFSVWLVTVAMLSACNLYGSLDKPSGDAQILSYARGCLDQGDYVCATNYYQQLSANDNDQKVSELIFTVLAQNQIFSIADLVNALGSGTGNAQSYLVISQLMAARGITGANSRVIIQQAYASAATITNIQLKAFMQFIAAVAMFSEVGANAVGSGGLIHGSDLVTNPSTCSCNNMCVCTAGCANPGTNNLDTNTGSEPTDMGVAANWNGVATPAKLVVAATSAAAQLTVFTGQASNYQGILSAISQIGTINATYADSCMRYYLGKYLLLF
jgi:hypothetical protein